MRPRLIIPPATFRRTVRTCFLGGVLGVLAAGAPRLAAQDVIQIVTFRFAPGATADAIAVFRDQALPLYEQNPHMLEFRAYREVESPVPLDLVVVSRFAGMEGMDRSNEALRALASQSGTSIGAVYGGISSHSTGHHDEFVAVETGSTLGSMDGAHLVVFDYMESGDPGAATTLPGEGRTMIGGLAGSLLISDGWQHLRLFGVESLADAQAAFALPAMAFVDGVETVTRRKRLVLAPVAELSVR